MTASSHDTDAAGRNRPYGTAQVFNLANGAIFNSLRAFSAREDSSMTDPASTTKTTNSTVKWGALFIIVLMLLSGVAVFFGSQSSTQPTPTDTAPQNVEQFSGEDVSGTVIEVFDTAIIVGQTSDGDKTEIDALIQAIPNIVKFTSEFSPLQQDGSVTYIANITLSANADHISFADSVMQLDLFDNPYVYFQGSAQVETEQQVTNSKNQLTRIELPNANIQAIVTPITQKGDTITGHFEAAFQGTKLVNANLVETQNVTASPSPISFSGNYTLKSLQPGLLIRGEVDYYPGLSLELLNQELSDINGVSGVTIPFLPYVNNTLFTEFSGAGIVSNDLNLFVTTRPESFDSFSLTPNGFSVNLKNVNVNEAKDILTAKINEITASNTPISFKAPRTQFFIDANTTTTTNKNTSLLIKNYFEMLDVNATVDIFQQGFFSVESLTSPDSNKTYSIPTGEVLSVVLPGHVVGDTIVGRIHATLSRGELVFPSGEEVTEE